MAQFLVGEAGFDMTSQVILSTSGEQNASDALAFGTYLTYRDGIAVLSYGIGEQGLILASLDLLAGADPEDPTNEPILSVIGLNIPADTFGPDLTNKDDAGFLAHLLAGDDGINGGPGDDLLLGQLGNDAILGNDGNDLLGGGVGNDRLEGGAGDDGLDGGDGKDNLFGGNGSDRMIADDGDDILFGEAGKDLMGGGAGDDYLIAGDGDDILDGSDYGADKMQGGVGDDTLATGLGSDSANGGDGADTFVLRAGAAGVDSPDTIADFVFADGDRLRNDTGLTLTDLLATATVVDGNVLLSISTVDKVSIVGVTALTEDFFV